MPHEENRKIIKVGKTSYGIILPKSWLRYYKLTDKDQLKVISNSNIIIAPLEERPEDARKKTNSSEVTVSSHQE